MRRLLPLFAASCSLLYSDPLATGVRVSPPPGEYVGEQHLLIVNDTEQMLSCEAYENDVCPSLADDLQGLGQIAAGERWELETVDCLSADFVCRTPDNPTNELPLRGWTWSITPAVDDE